MNVNGKITFLIRLGGGSHCYEGAEYGGQYDQEKQDGYEPSVGHSSLIGSLCAEHGQSLSPGDVTQQLPSRVLRP